MIPTISNECSQFLRESEGRYLIKNLPCKYEGFARVKVRVSKGKTKFTESFNSAFENKKYHLHQRSIFAYTDYSILTEMSAPNKEPFYVFPIDGYEVLFNPVVQSIRTDYKEFEQLHIDGRLVEDQLKMSYKAGTLREAIDSHCEVIIYGISHYYALRASLVEDYATFFNDG